MPFEAGHHGADNTMLNSMKLECMLAVVPWLLRPMAVHTIYKLAGCRALMDKLLHAFFQVIPHNNPHTKKKKKKHCCGNIC